MTPVQTIAKKTVDLTPEHVWTVLADHEGMAHWAPGLKVTLERPGAPERNGVGAVRRIVAPGPAPAIVEEIIGYEPNRKLVYKALSGVPLKGYVGSVELTAQGNGTEIRYSVSAEQRVPLVEKAVTAAIAHTLLSALVRRAKATA